MARIRTDDARFKAALELAEVQGGVVSRKQLYAAGITRWEIRGQVRLRRWQLVDGASSLVASGLERFTVDRIRASVPRGARIRRSHLFDIRQTRRWDAADMMPFGIPRTRPEVAAVRGFLWASTDKQATYLITVSVQQGIVPVEALGREALRIRRDKRRELLQTVIDDLLDGARSLGELDVGKELRRRGLPEPERQVLRKDRRGRYYLDLYWPQWKLVVEVDGIHHSWAQNVVGDALRQNSSPRAGRQRPEPRPEPSPGRHTDRAPVATVRMTSRPTGATA